MDRAADRDVLFLVLLIHLRLQPLFCPCVIQLERPQLYLLPPSTTTLSSPPPFSMSPPPPALSPDRTRVVDQRASPRLLSAAAASPSPMDTAPVDLSTLHILALLPSPTPAGTNEAIPAITES